jgi:hypothetical protein
LVQTVIAFLLTGSYNIHLTRLENLRAQSALTSSVKRSGVSQFQAFDAQYQALPEIKHLAREVMNTFSTDHFAGDFNILFGAYFVATLTLFVTSRRQELSEAATGGLHGLLVSFRQRGG